MTSADTNHDELRGAAAIESEHARYTFVVKNSSDALEDILNGGKGECYQYYDANRPTSVEAFVLTINTFKRRIVQLENLKPHAVAENMTMSQIKDIQMALLMDAINDVR